MPGRASARARLARLRSLPFDVGAAAFLAVAVTALGLYGLAFQALLPSRLPSPADWSAAAAVLAREARPGDAVALSPWWAERARQVLPDRVPVLARPSLADDDLVGIERIWLLALPAAPGQRAELPRELDARATAAGPPRPMGRLELTVHELRDPVLPLAFLPDRLATATVSVGERPCPRDDRGTFRCPSAPYVVVASEIREVAATPRRCLFAHPSPDPRAPLTVRFPGVPIGGELRGHTGIVGEAALGGEAPVRLAVAIDGAPVVAADEPPGSPGWHPFRADTAHLAGRAREITFTVSAGDVAARHFCFDAYTLR